MKGPLSLSFLLLLSAETPWARPRCEQTELNKLTAGRCGNNLRLTPKFDLKAVPSWAILNSKYLLWYGGLCLLELFSTASVFSHMEGCIFYFQQQVSAHIWRAVPSWAICSTASICSDVRAVPSWAVLNSKYRYLLWCEDYTFLSYSHQQVSALMWGMYLLELNSKYLLWCEGYVPV